MELSETNDNPLHTKNVKMPAAERVSPDLGLKRGKRGTSADTTFADDSSWFINRDGVLVTEQPPKPVGLNCADAVYLNFMLFSAKFMGLGDADGMDQAHTIITEQNTVALVAALLFTVEVATLQLAPFEKDEMNNGIAGAGLVDFIMSANTPVCLTCTVFSVLGMLNCVLVLISVGEMSGKAEIDAFSQRIGSHRLSGGFVLTFISLVLYAAYMIVYSAAFTQSQGGLTSMLILNAIIIAFILCIYPGIFLIMAMMINVKAESRENPSITLNRRELEENFKRFEALVGDPWKISPDNFTSYIQKLHSKRGNGPQRPALLSWMTQQAVHKLVQEKFEAIYLTEGAS